MTGSLTPLEERRLTELKHVVAVRALDVPASGRPASGRLARWRFQQRVLRPALALAAAAAAVVAGLTATSGGGTPAFAVTESPDGTVTITITDYRDTAQLTGELKHLSLPAAVVYVPDGKYCYQAQARLVRHPARALYTAGSSPDGPGIEMTFRTRLLQPGQSIIFGIGDAVESGFVVDILGTYVVTGQLTACQYHSVPGPFAAAAPGRATSPAGKVTTILASSRGNVRFPNSPVFSGK
jgi:hypothetical protein